MDEEVRRMKKMLETPIDFDRLITEGKLERVSATKYKLLVPLKDLPEYVGAQVIGMHNGEGGSIILQFRRQRHRPNTVE